MKRFVLIFLLALLPLPALAYDYDDCDEGTAECSCPPDLASSDVNQGLVSSAQTCHDSCESMGDIYNRSGLKEVTGYSLQCKIDGELTVVNQGDLGDDVDNNEVSVTYTDSELATNFEPIQLNVEIPGLGDVGTSEDEDGLIASNALGLYISAVYTWVLTAGSLLAVVMIMLGGLQYILARGNKGSIGKAQARIKSAFVGLVLLFGAYTIAFLVDPNTVVFDSLNVTHIDKDEWYEEEIYSEIITPGESISGDLAQITGDHVIDWSKDGRLNPEAVEALAAAGETLYAENGHNIIVTSALRTMTDQATLFYSNCLSNSSKSCTVLTCNIASGSSVISGNSSGYTLTGDLEGVTSKTTIINTLVANGNVANCPHTSTIAVDVWCDDGGKSFVHNPECQKTLSEAMVANGFCRIAAEAWHFEYDPMHVCGDCSTSNTHSYTLRGKTYTPDLSCNMYDYKNNVCTDQN